MKTMLIILAILVLAAIISVVVCKVKKVDYDSIACVFALPALFIFGFILLSIC